MSSKSLSQSSRKKSKSKQREKSRDRQRQKNHKLFITNLDGNTRQTQLQDQLRKQFSKYGSIDSLVVKKSRNSQYSFAFIEYQKGCDGKEAVKNLDQIQIGGKKIRVEFQIDSRRRKDRDQGCYICHKFGHFARQCREKRGMSNFQQDSRDRYRDERKKRSRSRHQKKRRSRSHKSKKQKKKRSRSRSNDSRRKNDKHKRSRSRNRSNSSRS